MESRNSYWFSHKYDERSTGVLSDMVSDHGAAAYGCWFIIKEMLCQEDNSRIEWNEKRIKRIARYMKVEEQWLKEWVKDCQEIYDLLTLEDGYLYCRQVDDIKNKRQEFRNKRVENGRRGGKASANKRRASGTENEASASKIEPIGSENIPSGTENEASASKSAASASKNTSKTKQNQPHNRHNRQDSTYNTSPPTYTEKEVELIGKWRGLGLSKVVCEKKIDLMRRVDQFKGKYSKIMGETEAKAMLNDFWFYWSAPDTKGKGVLRWEGESFFDIDARLRTWKKNERS